MSGVRGMRRGAGADDLDLRPHGTQAAYRRHYRRGQKPCRICRQGQARRWEDRKAAGWQRPTRKPRPRRTHLAGRDGRAVCAGARRANPVTAVLADVTCVRCHDLIARNAADARAIRRRRARAA